MSNSVLQLLKCQDMMELSLSLQTEFRLLDWWQTSYDFNKENGRDVMDIFLIYLIKFKWEKNM